MYDYDPYEDDLQDSYVVYVDLEDEDEPYWTPKRVLFIIITLLIIITFLAYSFLPLLRPVRQSPPPEGPPPTTLPMV